MSRESRLVVVLAVISILGVTGLTVMASQYRKSLAKLDGRRGGTTDASARAVRLVDGYLAARRAAKGVVERYPVSGNADTSGVYRLERSNAFAAHGMTYEDYASVREAWRTYRSGGLLNDPALVAVFRARRGELEAAGLGPVEPLDDAIK
jgi:type II secretory pathway pseudopilin PulG